MGPYDGIIATRQTLLPALAVLSLGAGTKRGAGNEAKVKDLAPCQRVFVQLGAQDIRGERSDKTFD